MSRRLPYRAPAWLPGPHAQTIWPAMFAPRERVDYRRERWDTPDGDFVEIDFTRTEAPGRPLLVLFHGLEGGSGSHYALAVMAEAQRRGWRGAVAHFRGCGGAINLAPRAYHSGDSAEIDWLLRRFARDAAAVFAVGVSLGGNALLKWLGEQGEAAAFVHAAAAVSAPQDLAAGAAALSRGFNRIYTENFLKTLKAKGLAKLEQHPGLFDRRRLLAARSFYDFDEVVTAPLHGFRSCHDYWKRASSKPVLGGIRVPTLLLNALNDPFLPAAALARRAGVSRSVRIEYPREGGHVGFLAGPFPGSMHWLPQRLFAFFDEHIGALPTATSLEPESNG